MTETAVFPLTPQRKKERSNHLEGAHMNKEGRYKSLTSGQMKQKGYATQKRGDSDASITQKMESPCHP